VHLLVSELYIYQMHGAMIKLCCILLNKCSLFSNKHNRMATMKIP